MTSEQRWKTREERLIKPLLKHGKKKKKTDEILGHQLHQVLEQGEPLKEDVEKIQQL